MRLVGTSSLLVVLTLLTACTQRVAGHGSGPAGTEPGQVGAAPAPVSAPDSRCPGRDVPRKEPTAKTAVLPAPATDVPPLPAESGSLSVGRLLSDLYFDQPGAGDAFAESGYVSGFQNSWGTGTPTAPDRRAQRTAVLEFADPRGACTFAEWERSTYRLVPRPDTEVPGALGYQVQADATFPGGVELLATKGEFVIVVVVLDRDTARRDSAAVELFTAQYSRA